MDAEFARLGLAERSVRLLTGRDIWASITPLLSPRRNLVAAFGHVGPGAAALLPLQPGDTLITDAGLDAVLAGTTSPHALLHWVKAGVLVHSLRGLNAKLVIAEDEPGFVVVGSADVTAAGPRQLFEAVTVSTEKHTVEEAQEAWLEWCDLAGPALTAGDLEPLLEQYGAGKPVTSQRPAAPTRSAPPARPVVTTRPATPVRPAAVSPPPSPVRPAVPPTPVRPAPPIPVPEPVAPPALAAEPETAAAPEPEETPETTEAPEAAETDVPRPAWPRPAELYLVSLVEGGEPSAEAEYRLEELAREYTHPGESGEPAFRVELCWADDGQGQDPPRTLRAGVHVIRVYSQKQGRALVGSRIEAPGLVLQAYTDEFAYPRRTYCYILTRESAARPAFGDLRKALATIGEKPNFRNSFQVPRKIEALLGLWPDLGYDPR
jgi:outer membrane biosynthesis protein TonB